MHTQKISETPLDFAEAIKEDIKSSKDDGVLKCVQCGMCTSTCPAARHSNYNPREIMERVFEGDETLLEDEDLWNCFYCYTCHSTCPVGNSVCEVNQIIKKELHMSSYMIIWALQIATLMQLSVQFHLIFTRKLVKM